MGGGGIASFADDEIDGRRADPLDVGPCGVEVRVVGNDVTRSHEFGGEDPLRRSALVRGEHVPEPGQVLDHLQEPEER